MKSAAKVIKKVTHVVQYISYASITLMMLLTTVDVIRRFVFGRTMTGVTDYSQILLIISMTAMAHALVERRFVIVSEFVEKFPKWVNFGIELFMGAVSFLYFFIVGWKLLDQIDSSIKFKEAYFMVKIVRWPFYGVLGIAFLACALGTIVYLYDRIDEFLHPKDLRMIDNPELAGLGLTEEDFVEQQEEGDE